MSNTKIEKPQAAKLQVIKGMNNILPDDYVRTTVRDKFDELICSSMNVSIEPKKNV